jgi:MFS family permease
MALNQDILPRRAAVWVFVALATAYFLSTLLRAITATLSPVLTDEFGLQARDLGLLAGAYFLGFSITQLPMGQWLDKHGPKKVVLSFLCVAVLGCFAFASANDFMGLMLARVLIGVGVSACLMAPLTGYRRWFVLEQQQRANSWMLMTGALGMLTSTLPVQWMLPVIGWRWMFVALAVLVALAIWVIYWKVPSWRVDELPPNGGKPTIAANGFLESYKQVWSHPYFRRMAPMGFFNYGGMIAMQTLWAGPWMVKVAGYTPLEAATGLFWLNVCMLLTFWLWGLVTPSLTARGYNANKLITYGVPLSLCAQVAIVMGGTQAGAMHWVLFCITSSFVSLAQPAVGMAFPSALAGRALSAYNLVLFLGVFVVQWGMGLMIDGFKATGWAEPQAFQAAMAVFFMSSLLSYGYFIKNKTDS